MLYENEKCPVCGKVFKEGDDIVTCPQCGTPHHRECYNSNGGCVNKQLHSTGFSYKRSENKNEDKAQENSQNPKIEKPAAPPLFNFPDFNENSEKNDYNKNSSEYQPHFKNNPFVINKSETIDGVSAIDIAFAVSTNYHKFIPKFRKNRLVNWNWSAFIFGPYYLLFRKMYGIGALFMSVEIVARIIVSAVFSKQINVLVTGLNNLINNSGSISQAEYYKQTQSLLNSSGAMEAFLIICVCLLAVHLITALFADKFYRKKIIGLVKDADSMLEKGASFAVNPAFGMGNENLSPQDLRKLFLAGKGGVSFWAPLLAFLIMEMIPYI
ncbi:MAG: DUF2628 domain-containing protein [Clostridiales bacterium]|nr:DUF2628 domain-containing protein [Clostridiales bacterium]